MTCSGTPGPSSAGPRFVDLFGDTDEEREWGVESLALLTNYFSIEDPTGFDPVDRELDMLEDLDGITIRGYSTASIATTTAVWSSPTTRRARRHPSDTPSAFFALKIYALLIRRRTGETPKELRLLYLNGPTMYKLEIDDRQLDAMDTQLRALWSTIDRALATRTSPPGRDLVQLVLVQGDLPRFTGTIASKGKIPAPALASATLRIPLMRAAVLRSTSSLMAMLWTSLKARVMISRRRATTSFSVQKYFCTSCTHSK